MCVTSNNVNIHADLSIQISQLYLYMLLFFGPSYEVVYEISPSPNLFKCFQTLSLNKACPVINLGPASPTEWIYFIPVTDGDIRSMEVDTIVILTVF